jgi:hypothetical protein
MAQAQNGGPEDVATCLPFDWPWDEAETIWPCGDCADWRAELLLVGPDEGIWVREWHAVDCPIWSEIVGLEA